MWPITRKIGNTTIIIHESSAKTEAEIEKVMNNLDAALYKAWLNIQQEQ